MEERNALAWLGRKIGWGLAPGQLDAWSELGVETVIDQLINPDKHDIAPRKDRFNKVSVARLQSIPSLATNAWVENAVQSPRPLETFMEFFWSDFFAVSFREVRPPTLMLTYMNKLANLSLGNFGNLLRRISRDPAMLDFLDGRRNTKNRPNENYARELLELYSVGVGNFTEDDVYAASRALTGWYVDRENGKAELILEEHDDTPQELLGVPNVRNMASTVDAVIAHEATAERIVGLLAEAILGPDYDTTITTTIIGDFADTLELKPVVRSLLELGVEGAATPSVLEPLGWYVMARRFPMNAPKSGSLREYFELSGQRPLFPPNVGGYPDADTYLSTTATLARLNLATHLVERTYRPIVGIDFVYATRNLDRLAEQFGLVDGFAPGTAAALADLDPGVDRMAAAIACPDLVVV